MKSLRLFVPLLALVAASCGESLAGYDEYALYRGAVLAKTIEVYSAALDESELRRVARDCEASGARTVVLTHELDASPSREVLRVIVADARAPGLARVLARLGVEVDYDSSTGDPSGGFSFLGQHYTGANDVLVATIADPEREGLPLTIYFGVDVTHAVHFVRDLTPAWRPAFRCWRGGRIEREGRWNERGEVEPSDVNAVLDAVRGQGLEYHSGLDFDLVGHGGLPAVADYDARLRSVRSELIELFATFADVGHLPWLEVHVWRDAETLALVTGAWEWSTVGPAPNQINVTLAPRNDGGLAVARAWAVALDRAPAEEWMLDGIALHVARTWWGEDLQPWTDFLVASGLAPDVATVVAPRTRVSPHIVMPMRAALFDWWLSKHGRDALGDAWRGTVPVELPSDAEWRAWLARSNAAQPANRDALRASRVSSATRNGFMRGLQLLQPSDSDGRGFRGYGTSACNESVRDALATGADAFGLMPRAFVDGGLAQWAGDPRSEPFATSTPDVALAAAVAPLGSLHVMFTPQLLTSRSGSWAGWNMGETQATWLEFFEEWRACVVHYALLAELCNADTFCLGSELALTTRSHSDPAEQPAPPEYLRSSGERWREVIAAARSAFRGALTYASNDQGEAPKLEFWEQLDLVGVDVFGRPSETGANATRPTDEQATALVQSELRSVADFGRLHGKPALVTEIGFAPTSETWRDAQRALGALDLEEQRRMYASLAAAVEKQNASSTPLAGLFLWCWSTDPSAGRELDRGFTPQNRPAAQWIARVFGQR